MAKLNYGEVMEVKEAVEDGDMKLADIYNIMDASRDEIVDSAAFYDVHIPTMEVDIARTRRLMFM